MPLNLAISTVNTPEDDAPDGDMLLIIVIALAGVIVVATFAIVFVVVYRKCKSGSQISTKDEPIPLNEYAELSPAPNRQYAALQSPPGSTLPRIYENVRPQSAPHGRIYDNVKIKTIPKPKAPPPTGYANLPVATPSS